MQLSIRYIIYIIGHQRGKLRFVAFLVKWKSGILITSRGNLIPRQRGIFERPKGSGTWWIDYTDGQGVRHREKVGRRRAAIQAYDLRRQQIREGRFLPPRGASGPTFRELADERMAARKPHLRATSYATDEKRLKPLLEAFGELLAAQVTPDRIGKFLAARIAGGNNPATANRFLWLLRSVFSEAVKHERVPVNPCSKVPNFKESPGRVRWLTDDEEEALRSEIRSYDLAHETDHEAEFDLALNTGMRRGEQFGLKRTGVDLENDQLTVSGKTGQRYVQLNRIARWAVNRLLERSAGSPYVVPGSEGQTDGRRWFRDCVRAAGIPNFRFHDIRHTFASRLVMGRHGNEGADIRKVQVALGHKSIEMTTKYSHLSTRDQKQTVEKLVEAATLTAPQRHHAENAGA